MLRAVGGYFGSDVMSARCVVCPHSECELGLGVWRGSTGQGGQWGAGNQSCVQVDRGRLVWTAVQRGQADVEGALHVIRRSEPSGGVVIGAACDVCSEPMLGSAAVVAPCCCYVRMHSGVCAV